jgi:NADPH:quinone reductase-like Zn-dependent oxidoreductase
MHWLAQSSELVVKTMALGFAYFEVFGNFCLWRRDPQGNRLIADFAGIAIAVQQEVCSIRPGEHVTGVARTSLASEIPALAWFTQVKPWRLSFHDAACVFSTYMFMTSLLRSCHAQLGESVWYHSVSRVDLCVARDLCGKVGAMSCESFEIITRFSQEIHV